MASSRPQPNLVGCTVETRSSTHACTYAQARDTVRHRTWLCQLVAISHTCHNVVRSLSFQFSRHHFDSQRSSDSPSTNQSETQALEYGAGRDSDLRRRPRCVGEHSKSHRSSLYGCTRFISDLEQVEDIFQKVATWRHHGVDYEHLSLQLEIAHLAYQRWQKTVKLVEPSTAAGQFNLPIAEPREAETVGRLLGAISAAFQDAEKTSKRYETEDDRDDSPMEVDEKKSPLEILTGKVRAANKARQSGTGVLQKARWMVHDKKALETLVERVCSPALDASFDN